MISSHSAKLEQGQKMHKISLRLTFIYIQLLLQNTSHCFILFCNFLKVF